MIYRQNGISISVKGIGVDAGKCSDTTGRRPRARAFAIRHGDALAALNEGGDLLAGDDKRLQRFQNLSP